MPTTAATADTTARTVDDQFLDLICSDADLLEAQFEAIIAAEWPEPPADAPDPSAAGRSPGSGPARRAADLIRGPAAPPRHPGVGGWARQRSPPVQQLDTEQAGKVGDRRT